MKPPPCFEDPEAKRMIKQICEEHQIDVDLLKDLCELVGQFSGFGKRFGLPDDIASIISRFISRAPE